VNKCLDDPSSSDNISIIVVSLPVVSADHVSQLRQHSSRSSFGVQRAPSDVSLGANTEAQPLSPVYLPDMASLPDAAPMPTTHGESLTANTPTPVELPAHCGSSLPSGDVDGPLPSLLPLPAAFSQSDKGQILCASDLCTSNTAAMQDNACQPDPEAACGLSLPPPNLP
jgi:hypothetical protein